MITRISYTAVCMCADTLLGPYLGKTVRKDLVEPDQNNQWLWEVSIFLQYCDIYRTFEKAAGHLYLVKVGVNLHPISSMTFFQPEGVKGWLESLQPPVCAHAGDMQNILK